MKPLQTHAMPAFSTAVPAAILAAGAEPNIEPRLVVIRCNGETIATSSAVIRKETLDGPLYMVPHADVAIEMLVADMLVCGDLQVWNIRTADGDVLDAGYSSDRPLTGLKPGYIGFAADKVEISAEPGLGDEPCRMI